MDFQFIEKPIEPKKPDIIEVVLRMSVNEAKALRALCNFVEADRYIGPGHTKTAVEQVSRLIWSQLNKL